MEIALDNIPTFPATLDLPFITTDATGSFKLVDNNFDETTVLCSASQKLSGEVTIVATGLTSGLTASDTLPDGFFCGSDSGSFGVACP